ncbi:MAG: SDR family oxidoreductase [Oscillospiraceae bacterium]
MDRLKDKVVIMTGADGGICHCASQLFCKEGAKVVMVDIDPQLTEKVAAIVADGGDAIGVVADVSKKEDWEKVLKAALDKYGKVDCCVNGAAQFSYTGDWNSPKLDMEEWDRVMNTNVKSMLWSYQVVLQYMIDNGIKGNFINFTSATALSYMGSACQAYPMSKAAIKICTNDMVSPNGKYGIRFNMLAPNLVYVPKQAKVYVQFEKWFNSLIPLEHYGEAIDAAYTMLFLASDEAKYINGVCIPVDGGWHTCH